MGAIENTYGKLSSPPLVYTLIMLRFPVQSALEKQIPAIQESLKQMYPIFEKRIQQGFEVASSSKGQSIKTVATPEFLFFDSERTKGVLIKEDRIVFHSTVYPNFNEFSSWFRDAALPIVEALSVSHYLGCGIRYVDALAPNRDAGESLADFLNPSLLHFSMGDDEDIIECVGSNQGNVYRSKFGNVTFKSYILFKDEICVPPDLSDLSSLLRFKPETRKAPFAVLDFDHGYVAPDGTAETLDMEELLTKLDGMHNVASNTFLKAINTNAIARWK